MEKEFGFDLEGEEEFLLDLDYYYYYRAAKLNGLPEYCYPEESESEINLPVDLAEKVRAYALDVMVPRWIKGIEAKVQDLLFDNMPAQWFEKDQKDADESRASDRYDDLQYEKHFGWER